VNVVGLHRTLEQELLALTRGASLECLVCGEFVMRRADELLCPECGSSLHRAAAAAGTGAQQPLWGSA
jgi:Zn finger protein HypA/HybF involved in hydrogenase expression